MRSVVANLLLLVFLGLVLHRRPGERETRWGAIEDPAAARAYLRLNDWPQFRLLRWLVIRDLVRIELRGTAVDLGCGPGSLSLAMARLSPQLSVVGIDPSPEMVALAAGKAGAAGLAGQATFRIGSAESIPLPDASVDLLVSTLSLHHWSHPVAGLREVARVVRPGGRFLVLDLRRDMALLPWLLVRFARRFVLPSTLRTVGEPEGSVRSAYTPEEVRRLAAEAGLTDCAITTGPAWLALDGLGT